jgi:hypothetical protein
MRRFTVSSILTLLLAAPAAASAQKSMLIGVVRRDSAGGAPVAGVQVELPKLKQRVRTNAEGGFRLELPPGRHAVVVRQLGFTPLSDTVELRVGEGIVREFVLMPQAAVLDSVRVTAPETKYISPNLRDFEARRKQGFGRFITEEELRQNDNRRIGDVVLSKFPGIRPVRNGSKTYLTSDRAARFKGQECYVEIYVDGVTMSPTSSRDPAVNVDELNVNQFGAVEYYAGGASIPAQFNRTQSNKRCGVLLLWSRER